jgi:hypothetical protein
VPAGHAQVPVCGSFTCPPVQSGIHCWPCEVVPRCVPDVHTQKEEISRRIIAKTASPHSPITINEFRDVSEATMVRYLHLLKHIGVLQPMWDNGVRKFEITPFGKEIASVIAEHS